MSDSRQAGISRTGVLIRREGNTAGVTVTPQLFPTCHSKIISRGDTGGGLVAVQLVLRGTHTGSFIDCTPPTGRTVAYSLASFAKIEGDKIRTEHIYLDRQTVAEQLGLKAK